jgi:hypothetical protein
VIEQMEHSLFLGNFVLMKNKVGISGSTLLNLNNNN